MSKLQKTSALYIFLSGSLKKGDADTRDRRVFWTEEKEQRILRGVTTNPVVLLNPARFQVRRSDYFANMGCDLHFVSVSDILLADLAEKKGIGIGAEMMFAQISGVPVVSICPEGSFYRPAHLSDFFGQDVDDWIHPFVYGLSDYIVETLNEAIALINELSSSGLGQRAENRVNQSIRHYFRARLTWEGEEHHDVTSRNGAR